MNGPGDVDDASVARFMALTGSDVPQAKFFLEAANGNTEAAVHMYEGHPAPPPAVTSDTLRRRNVPTPPRPRAPLSPPNSGTMPAHPAPRSLMGRVLRLPWWAFRSSLGLVASLATFSFHTARALAQRLLPSTIVRSVQEAVHVVQAAVSTEQDPQVQARLFIEEFKLHYGDQHPNWLESDWRQAAAVAHADFKFLFAYLHAPKHENTDAYCREVLCDPTLVQYVSERFVAWGGDIRYSDPFSLATRLSATTYPLVALLAFSASRTKLVVAVQGSMPANRLLAILQRAVDEQGVVLDAERVEREERERSRQLMAEQNAEYEASLARDREREAQRNEVRRRVEEEERSRREEEERQLREQQEEERRKAEMITAIERRRQEKRASLPPEPSAGTPSAQVRVRLPDGSNHSRLFPADSTIQHIHDFVDSLDTCTLLKYNLVLSYPRKVFDRHQMALTLTEAGLTPSAALFVQAGDDE